MPNTNPLRGRGRGDMRRHSSASEREDSISVNRNLSFIQADADQTAQPRSMPEPPPRRPGGDNLTDSLGRPVTAAQNDNTKTVGRNGPSLLTDVNLIDKIAHFDRERIPERVVHAKGAGAGGIFTPYASMSRYTSAGFLSQAHRPTKVFVRFSTVIGGRGSADTVRDPRGFAVKFYTNEGIYDITGNDLPVFFIRDAVKFPDVIHSLKPSPDSNLRVAERFWDFISYTPEATHMITWLYSDRGTIKDYCHIDGFGVNTYIWVNADGERRYVKYHWKTKQGLETINRHEAERLAGSDPDIAVRLLREAIETGKYPSYELCVQLMSEKQAQALPFDVLDDTKTWDEVRFPLIKVGLMTLNRNPVNFFNEVEQVAFCPANIVPGIELSNDKMLTGRSFSYADTQRHRIGPNFAQLPVNRPINPVDNGQRDGAMSYITNPSPINYLPNSLAGGRPYPAPDNELAGEYVEGEIVNAPIEKTDDFTQAGEHYYSLTPEERAALCDNIAVELAGCRSDIIDRVMNYFAAASPEFADGVMEAMKLY